MIRARIPGTDAVLVLDDLRLETPEVRRWLEAVAARIGRKMAERAARPARAPSKERVASVAFAVERQKQERVAERNAISRMHFEVWEANLDAFAAYRAGCCDCGCGYVFRHTTEGELDHWIARSQGGEHSRLNGWRLRPECHADKEANRPDRTTWNLRRMAYCQRESIPFVERRVR